MSKISGASKLISTLFNPEKITQNHIFNPRELFHFSRGTEVVVKRIGIKGVGGGGR